jgi:hypothetical protein
LIAMFGRRRAARAKAQRGEQPADPAQSVPAEPSPLAVQQAEPGRPSVTLGTRCGCGHLRKDHRGLQMESRGPCLECDCTRFTATADTLGELRAMLARVERLQQAAASLQANGNGTAAEPADRGNARG